MTERTSEFVSEERLKIALDAWKYVTSVQMHFNDMEMKVRNLYFTIVAAAVGLIGVVQGRRVEIFYPEIKISLAIFVMLAIIPISMLFYFMDRHWYHRLLQGAVRQGVAIEEQYKELLPEIQLGSKIRDESPVEFKPLWFWKCVFLFVRDPRFRKSGKLHSDQKIEVLYKTVMWGCTVAALIYSLANGIQIHNCTIIPYAQGRVCPIKPSTTVERLPLLQDLSIRQGI